MVIRPLPSLPTPGDTDWDDWAAGVHDRVAEIDTVTAALPNTTDTGYDIVLLLGQSNMQGAGGAPDAAIDVTHPRVYSYARVGTNANKIVQGVDPLQHPNTGSNNNVGPGMPFARWYADTIPGNRRVLLVPAAYSGAGFVNGNDGARWNPGADFSYNNVANSLYENAITQAKAALTAAGANARIVAALWVQGEADINVAATTYRTYLEYLIDGLRSRLNIPTLPFVIGSMVPEYINASNGAIAGVHAATPSRKAYTSYVVGPSGYLYTGDGLNVHYTTEGQREQGRRLLAGLTAAKANTAPASAVAANPPVAPANYTPPVNSSAYTFASAPTNWYTSPTTTLTASGGNLLVPVTAAYQTVASPDIVDLTAKSVTWHVASLPAGSITSSDIYLGVTPKTINPENNTQDSAGFTLTNTASPYTDARVINNGARTVNGAVPNAANRALGYYRVRTSSGNLLLEYSTDNSSWTLFWSGTVTWSLTATRAFITAGHYNSGEADGTVGISGLTIV
jgi:hypothetical protein